MHSGDRGLGRNLLWKCVRIEVRDGFEGGLWICSWDGVWLRTACEDDPFDVGFVGEFVAAK